MSLRLPDKDAAEKVVIDFDFLSELAAGETIGSALVSITVIAGVDAAAAAMIEGAAVIDAGHVYQRIGGGVTGNTYKPRCVATISSGNVLARAGELPIREA